MSDHEVASDAASPSSSSGGVNNPYRSSPNCGKCRNHGIILPLRGHKRECRYRDCECECCILTVQRRVVMAKQTAHLRQKRLEERRASEGEENYVNKLPPTPLTPPPTISNVGSPQVNARVADLEEHRYAANELIKLFGLEMNALPFAYAILGVSGDIQTAAEMVSEATKELTPRRASLDSDLSRPGPGPSSFRNFHNRNLIDDSNSRKFSGPLSLVKPRSDLPQCSSSKGLSSNCTFNRDRTPSPPQV